MLSHQRAVLGLGTGRLASLGRGTTYKSVVELLSVSHSLGVDWIDTADSYTAGRCERMLGDGMKAVGLPFKVVTKVGFTYGDLPAPFTLLNLIIKKALFKLGRPQNFSPRYLRHSLNRSLARLKRERVEGYLLHNPSLEVIKRSEIWKTLSDLKMERKCLGFGVSTPDPAVVAAICELWPECDFLQIPVNPRSWNDFAKVGYQFKTRFSGIIMANHVLAGPLVRDGILGQEMKEIMAETSATEQTVLLRWAASLGLMDVILIGTISSLHLKENRSALDVQMPILMQERLSRAATHDSAS